MMPNEYLKYADNLKWIDEIASILKNLANDVENDIISIVKFGTDEFGISLFRININIIRKNLKLIFKI